MGTSPAVARGAAPLVIEGDADDRPEVIQLAALFRVAGHVHFAFWRTVADKTGCRIVFGDDDPERGTPVGLDDRGLGLPSGPLWIEQLCLDDVGLPGVGTRLAA